MKITDIQIDVIRREFATTALKDDRSQMGGEVEQGILRVLTDEGVEGNCIIGDATTSAGTALFDPILNVLKPEVMGRDPASREWLWHRLDVIGNKRGMSFPAWAVLDVALWDIAGKAAGQPIYKLLGAQREAVDIYATYPPRHDTPAGYVEEAEDLVSRGFKAYKIHPGVMATDDVIELVTGVRRTVGDGFPLMLDPNNGYRFRKAYEIGRALDELGFFWFEDPVPWVLLDSVIELTNRLQTPLCMSDQPEFRFREAADFIRLKAVQLPRGTARKIGITGLKKLCSLAEGFGLNCEIGTTKNSALDAANLHVMLSVSNCDYFEWWLPKEATQFGYIEDMQPTSNKQLVAPTAPGLGYEWDWDWLSAHTVETLT